MIDLPRRPSIDEKLDLGYEIIEQLLLHKKPLTDEHIERYSTMWIADRRLQKTYYSKKLAHNALMETLDSLSECKPSEPVPEAVVKRLCLCSRASVTNYNSLIVKVFKERVRNPDA